MSNDDKTRGDIVIIRRGSGEDQAGGKGGAWKIAYADFVTAMMAFFLVMWLINASNEETRAQVASYFNPIKLTDSTTGSRSLRDVREARKSQTSDVGIGSDGKRPAPRDVRHEAELLADPKTALELISESGAISKAEVATSLKFDKMNPGIGDPFDPPSWRTAEENGVYIHTPQEITDVERQDGPEATDQIGDEDGEIASANAIRRDIESGIDESDISLKASVEVRPGKNGILVSLTASESFEMFSTGSATPEPQLLKLVDAVARALQSRKGKVIIRGHTDSRPYRNKYYDNWQLSTARAHLARYMLISGGLDEERIARVEGVADREPKNGMDPQAAANRRIEILLETTGQ